MSFTLDRDEIIVFRVDLSPELWADFLPESRRRRIEERFSHQVSRNETLSCDGALYAILGQLLGVPPAEVEVKRAAKGKPYVDATAEGEIGFSLTHSHGVGVIAVGRRARVGVDLEPVTHKVDCEAVAEGFFPPNERDAILAAPEAERLGVLLHAFTRFESAVKATGDGLTVPADDYELLRDGMLARHVNVGEGWICCVTADGPEWTHRVLDAQTTML